MRRAVVGPDRPLTVDEPTGDVCGTAPRDVADTCERRDAGFRDVSADGGVHDPRIRCLAGYGIAEGHADGTSRPAEQLTGAQVATSLARALDVLLDA